MNEYLSGKCAHCGRKKEEHQHDGRFGCERNGYNCFFDSGLKLLHDRAPELLQAAREVIDNTRWVVTGNTRKKLDELESIIGDILKKEEWEHRFLDGPDTSWHPGRLTNLDMSVKLVYEERRSPIDKNNPKIDMKREQVYKVIDGERDYQDMATADPKRPDMIAPFSAGDGIASIQHNLNKALEAWYSGSAPYSASMGYLRKIAGTIVKIAEQYGIPER